MEWRESQCICSVIPDRKGGGDEVEGGKCQIIQDFIAQGKQWGFKSVTGRGAWVDQLLKHLILDFGSDNDPRVVRSTPTSLSAPHSLLIFSLPLSPFLLCSLLLSFSFSLK